ncbi:hypothetical protein CJ20_059 [Escherichia phage CJ20]|nr:hypothetical protein CJ20_059 [Escherichia phage CJ20]
MVTNIKTCGNNTRFAFTFDHEIKTWLGDSFFSWTPCNIIAIMDVSNSGSASIQYVTTGHVSSHINFLSKLKFCAPVGSLYSDPKSMYTIFEVVLK